MEVVSRLLLGVLSTVVDVNLLEEEIGWKGEAREDVKLMKAIVL